jgi:hypothetical protein
VSKKKYSCGYRVIKKCLDFNDFTRKGISTIPYDDGIYMSDIKEYLDNRMSTTAYKIDNKESLSSNMIVHTFYMNKGHYLYVVYSGEKYMYIYDPRCIIPYKLIRKRKINKYINFNKEVVALKINQDIDYRHYRVLYSFELFYVFCIALFGFERASLLFCASLLIFLVSNSNEK